VLLNFSILQLDFGIYLLWAYGLQIRKFYFTKDVPLDIKIIEMKEQKYQNNYFIQKTFWKQPTWENKA
jgi:hypothetical protein